MKSEDIATGDPGSERIPMMRLKEI